MFYNQTCCARYGVCEIVINRNVIFFFSQSLLDKFFVVVSVYDISVIGSGSGPEIQNPPINCKLHHQRINLSLYCTWSCGHLAGSNLISTYFGPYLFWSTYFGPYWTALPNSLDYGGRNGIEYKCYSLLYNQLIILVLN